MMDRWLELFEVLSRNRVRTLLTALSVAWGIFVLVLLLGLGRGLENNVLHMFRDDAVNSIWVFRGKTTIPHDGYPVGRRIAFDNRDHAAIAAGIDDVDHITSRFYPGTSGLVRWRDLDGTFDLRGVHPAHRYLENTEMVRGRFLNDRDIEEKRKVAVVGEEVVKALFRGADPVGEWIDVGGMPFRVVGVFTDSGGVDEMQQIYLPISTAQGAYAGGDTVHQLMFTVGDADAGRSAEMVEEVRGLLARAHHFSEADRQAVRIRDNVEQFQQISGIFTLISGFVWVVGLGTVAAGIVGVSNIMLVSVKERTQEIGLRKALGATPASIVGMILQEALLLTGVSGYFGLVAGVGLLELLRRFIPENEYIRNPEVDLRVGLAATGLLVLAGAVAGLVPAVRAATVNPITALRDA